MKLIYFTKKTIPAISNIGFQNQAIITSTSIVVQIQPKDLNFSMARFYC